MAIALRNSRRLLRLVNQLLDLQRLDAKRMQPSFRPCDLVLDLRPEPRLITVLFSDIVGFTQLSNTLRSRRVAELLNEYLESMTKTEITVSR